MSSFREEIKELQIGQQIRKYRQELRLTLQDLSSRTELSKPLLSQIENEQVIPPLATLLCIAKALHVPLQTFFEEEDNNQKCLIVRAGQSNQFHRRPNQGSQPQPYRYQSLASAKKHKHMEPFLIEFDPKLAPETDSVEHSGEEFLYLIEGKVELYHAGETYLIGPGDSVYWDSSQPHSLKAVGEKPARAIAVIYSPP